MAKTVDSHTYMLAEHFLQEFPDAMISDVRDLASDIQDTVEGWIRANEDRLRLEERKAAELATYCPSVD